MKFLMLSSLINTRLPGRKCSLNFLKNFSRLLSNTYLYPPRETQTKVVAILKPYLIESLDQNDIRSLRSSLQARQLPDVDLESLAITLIELREIQKQVCEIEHARKANTVLVNEKLSAGVDKESITHLFRDGTNLRSTMKNLTRRRHELEDVAVPQLLHLPNKLHPTTPVASQSKTVFVHGTPHHFEFPCLDHQTIGRQTGTLNFVEPGDDTVAGSYYLHGQAALLEIAVQDWMFDHFNSHGFIQFANPDICKAVISEGCGQSTNNPADTFWVKPEEHLVDYHLCGSASLPAFCAYHAKYTVNQLPVNYFASGRCYRAAPLTELDSTNDLFNVHQMVATHFFSASESGDLERLFEEAVKVLLEAFVELHDLHFRMIEVEGARLTLAESRRSEIQMWSPASQRYRTVSSVSSCGDFISRRLWMIYRDANNHQLLQVVHGTAVSFPTLLACIMENMQRADGTFTIPNLLERYMLKS